MLEKPEAQGDSTGSWRAPTGTHKQIDSTTLGAARATPSAEELATEAAPGSDPYNRSTTASRSLAQSSRRRSLDDMRKLSEAIKRSRGQRQQ